MFRIIRDKERTCKHVWIGGDDPDWKPFPYDSKLKLCFNDVTRSTLMRVMRRVLSSNVRFAAGFNDERISGARTAR
jgi:hypothetical protein